MVDVIETAAFNSSITNILSQISTVNANVTTLTNKVAAVETGLGIITQAINKLQAPVKLDKIDLTYVDGSGIKQVITLTTGSGI